VGTPPRAAGSGGGRPGDRSDHTHLGGARADDAPEPGGSRRPSGPPWRGYLVSVAVELQADCLAGATLAGAQQDGLIQLRPGVDRELGAALTALADSYPWTNKRDHGNAQQRIGAYNLGVRQGVPGCLAQ
jgi:hypothetical protein